VWKRSEEALKIATYNVNGITTRLPQLLTWLAKESPDVVCLQELKADGRLFPKGELEKSGYGAIWHGQKSWNGVAILTKGAVPKELRRGLPGDPRDDHSRYLEAAVDGILVACLYLPNGNPQPGPKFDYKLAWFERLISHAKGLWTTGHPTVLAGDFNVVPTDFDIYNPKSWRKDALLQPESRAAYARLLKQGWTDALRDRHPGEAIYTFWDYFRQHWPRNAGLRIDHVLLSAKLKRRLVDANVDKWVRGEPHASDHAPVWVELSDITSKPTTRKVGKKMPRKPKALERYVSKRNFAVTPEPQGGGTANTNAPQFVIQKHWASRLHYDFRLELNGTMKSWAVPKGPSFDPKDKRMAVHVEDHPISYNEFEGQIPEKQYGAGKVIIWDKGTWSPVGDPMAGYRKGNLKFTLNGHKMHGAWVLIRMKSREPKQDAWLLIKEKDALARPAADFSVTDEMPDSVAKLPAPQAPQSRSKDKPAKPAKSSATERGQKTAGPRAMPAGAIRKAAPATLSPLLATLVDRPPADPAAWLYEVKFDGYRMLAKVEAGRVRLISRNGKDWTDKVKHLAEMLESMSLKPGWLDGEIVMLADNGATSFNKLQNAFDSAQTQDIQYFLFDVPYYDGYDLTQVPLQDRRELLRSILDGAPAAIRFSEAFEAAPNDLVASACKLGLEGIIGKRRDSVYSARRSPDWIKLKCGQRQEFVVAGWTDPKGSRSGLGSLLLGVHDAQGDLVYAGKVGSGFNETSLEQISGKLKKLAATQSPFKARIPERDVHWVKPKLVAEVTFSEWTGSGQLRHPVFHALRTDKPARAIIKEDPVAPLGPDAEETQSLIPPSLRVSHPDRVVDATSGITKIEIIRYYALVGELMMKHLKGRPVSLVKAPQGINKPIFFQKHAETYKMEGVELLDRKIDPDHPPYIEIATPLGLLSAAQMNVIEFHTWNATRPQFQKPDRMIFDLDPGEGATWASVQQGAELMRSFLAELKLPAFLKTSGGKGLHVVTPLKPEFDWDTVKGFSETIVVHMAGTLPKLFVAKSGPKNRVGRVFIDYLRNGFGATTASAWSARARPGLGISVPVAWPELAKLQGGAQWSIKNAHLRLASGNTPWASYGKSAVSLVAAMKMLEFKPLQKARAKQGSMS
jgi:bifunctional non-homologous end joining protein LigD